MEKHVTIVGILQIVTSAFGLMIAAIIFVAVTGAGLVSGDDTAILVTSIVGPLIAFFFAFLSLPGLIGGIWLLQYKEWSRILTIIVGILGLLNIPFGTALGIYTLWVLFNKDTIQLFKESNQ
ncbi:MAG: hypothetical protein KAR38_16620 [Calditrichia bacterium]|nr:hypothetical protein [Calditrichia bacterium]